MVRVDRQAKRHARKLAVVPGGPELEPSKKESLRGSVRMSLDSSRVQASQRERLRYQAVLASCLPLSRAQPSVPLSHDIHDRRRMMAPHRIQGRPPPPPPHNSPDRLSVNSRDLVSQSPFPRK